MSDLNAVSVHEMQVGRSIGYYTDDELLWWVKNCDLLDEYADDHSVFQLITSNGENFESSENAFRIFEEVVERYALAVAVESQESETLAQKLFKRRLTEYVSAKLDPWEVCRMIGPIEVIYDFPVWLGDMYNVCDWCEVNSTPDEFKHLPDEICKHLTKLSEIGG